MKKETSIRNGAENSGKTTSQQDSGAGNDKSARKAKSESDLSDSNSLVESANEHMLRAWKSIHQNDRRERKAS